MCPKELIENFSKKDIVERITFRLHTASRIVQQLSQHKLKQLDLTQAQWRALSGVCIQPNATLQELTDFAHISQPLMSQAIKSLEKRKLVLRQTPETDRRSSVIEATENGVELYKKAYTAMIKVEQQICSVLGKRNSERLKELLDTTIIGLG